MPETHFQIRAITKKCLTIFDVCVIGLKQLNEPDHITNALCQFPVYQPRKSLKVFRHVVWNNDWLKPIVLLIHTIKCNAMSKQPLVLTLSVLIVQQTSRTVSRSNIPELKQSYIPSGELKHLCMLWAARWMNSLAVKPTLTPGYSYLIEMFQETRTGFTYNIRLWYGSAQLWTSVNKIDSCVGQLVTL